RPRLPSLLLEPSPTPFPAQRVCVCVHLSVSVYEFVGPTLPCWSPSGRRCIRANAAGSRWARRPGYESAELSTLSDCVYLSESPGA
ncbi:hypothetical protein P7K49_022287, partial [Saguinus oedipus]